MKVDINKDIIIYINNELLIRIKYRNDRFFKSRLIVILLFRGFLFFLIIKVIFLYNIVVLI